MNQPCYLSPRRYKPWLEGSHDLVRPGPPIRDQSSSPPPTPAPSMATGSAASSNRCTGASRRNAVVVAVQVPLPSRSPGTTRPNRTASSTRRQPKLHHRPADARSYTSPAAMSLCFRIAARTPSSPIGPSKPASRNEESPTKGKPGMQLGGLTAADCSIASRRIRTLTFWSGNAIRGFVIRRLASEDVCDLPPASGAESEQLRISVGGAAFQ
jgi:hypothetical protein